MQKTQREKQERGFILNFTILFVAAMLLIVVTTTTSTLSVLQAATQQKKSLQAFYAADAGVACVKYLQIHKNQPFNTTSTSTLQSCGVGSSFVVGGPPNTTIPGVSGGSQCQATTYPLISLVGFSNGACAKIEVEVVPITTTIVGVPTQICTLSVQSRGFSSCTASAGVVERLRWATI